jgi:hydroxyacylglutathione hydrolase
MAGHRIIPVPAGRNDGMGYILICNDTKDAAVIDSDTNLEKILATLAAEQLNLKYILLTHCHFDHVSSSDALRERTGAQTAIHRLDVPGLSDPKLNMSGPFRQPPITGRQIDIELEQDDVIRVGNIDVKVLLTPGHTPGSCCFLVGSDMFTGDTLFRGSYGNTGFPGGDMGALMLSAARLLSMDENIKIYPGHGQPSTIGRERVMNPISI